MPEDTGYLRSTNPPYLYHLLHLRNVYKSTTEAPGTTDTTLSGKRQQISPSYWITQVQQKILISPCRDAINSYTSSTLQRLGLLDRKTGLMPCRSGVGGAMLEFARSLSPCPALTDKGPGDVGDKASS